MVEGEKECVVIKSIIAAFHLFFSFCCHRHLIDKTTSKDKKRKKREDGTMKKKKVEEEYVRRVQSLLPHWI